MIRQFLFAIALLFFWIISYFSFAFYHFYRSPIVSPGVKTTLTIYPGDQLTKVADTLAKKKWITSAWLFLEMSSLLYPNEHLHYGRYQINHLMTSAQLLHHLMLGEGLMQYRITIVDGWRFKKIRAALQANQNLKKDIAGLNSHQLITKLGGHWQSVEGWLFPDTYFFTWGNSDFSVLKTAFLKMKRVLQEKWEKRAPDLPYKTPYQALIAASLIQRETAVTAEKPLVSSVIEKRLKKGMRLQIDPTVQYGLDQSFGSAITKSDLASETPYNTYKISGLPPTPICMPNSASIQAALHPAETDYFYYVADGTGGHYFSATYHEHKKAVKRYRRFQRQIEQESIVLEAWFRQGVSVAKRVNTMVHWLQL